MKRPRFDLRHLISQNRRARATRMHLAYPNSMMQRDTVRLDPDAMSVRRLV